jgi:hypothetical protein
VLMLIVPCATAYPSPRGMQQGGAVGQAVSRQPLIAEARGRSRVHPREICGKVALDQSFLRVLRVFRVVIIPLVLHVHVHVNCLQHVSQSIAAVNVGLKIL